jgi:hypothetical protein
MSDQEKKKDASPEKSSAVLEIDEKTKKKFRSATNVEVVQYIQSLKQWRESSLEALGTY